MVPAVGTLYFIGTCWYDAACSVSFIEKAAETLSVRTGPSPSLLDASRDKYRITVNRRQTEVTETDDRIIQLKADQQLEDFLQCGHPVLLLGEAPLHHGVTPVCSLSFQVELVPDDACSAGRMLC